MRRLKIIYTFGYSLQTGGHFKSALSLMSNLVLAGHQLTVLAAPGGIDEIIREFTVAGADIQYIPQLERSSRFPLISGARPIARIARERSVDIIHAQDFISASHAYLAAILSGKAFVLTEAGGAFKHHLPPRDSETVLFSQELLDATHKAYPKRKDRLHLIRARIDTSLYKPEKVESEFVEEYGLPESGLKIVVATRLDAQKSSWLDLITRIAQTIVEESVDLKIIAATYGDLLPLLRDRADQVNKNSARGSVIHLVGQIKSLKHMIQLYSYADVVIGSGRGILEAMACRKPVVVLGENGEGEILAPENIEETAYYNFSGRHFRYRPEPPESVIVLLRDLLMDPDRRGRLADFSYEYIQREMDARIGAEQLAKVYAEALERKPGSLMSAILWYGTAAKEKISVGIRNRISPRRL